MTNGTLSESLMCKVCDKGYLGRMKISLFNGPVVVVGVILTALCNLALLFLGWVVVYSLGTSSLGTTPQVYAMLSIGGVALAVFLSNGLGFFLCQQRTVLKCGFCRAIVPAH